MCVHTYTYVFVLHAYVYKSVCVCDTFKVPEAKPSIGFLTSCMVPLNYQTQKDDHELENIIRKLGKCTPGLPERLIQLTLAIDHGEISDPSIAKQSSQALWPLRPSPEVAELIAFTPTCAH